MVCVLASELNQSISRSSSLKDIRSTRKPTRAAAGRFEDVMSAPEIIRKHKEASISPERLTEPREERIIEAVKELYTCSTSKASFNVYAHDVTLRDDAGYLSVNGLEELRAHFVALQRAYSIANIIKFKASPRSSALSRSIIIDVEIEYLRDIDALRPSKIVKGLVILELSDSQEHIARQTEKWDHVSQKHIEDTFLLPVHRRTSLSHGDAMYA
ncbi:hypothetical protein PENSPDRAFT_651003 [Peniophora sp. CONT]|nr:hypothetical protein PENSPDRAFT_651003 [Peniophora sp. CONT]